MNGKLAKHIRAFSGRAGHPAVAYDQPAWVFSGGRVRGGPGVTVRLSKDCDRYLAQRMKRAIARGHARG